MEAATVFDEPILAILEIMIIFNKLKDVVGENSVIYSTYLKEKKSSVEN